MDQERLAKVLDGVALVDEEKASLVANRDKLAERSANMAKAIVSCAEQIAEIEAKLALCAGDPAEVKARAEAMASALSAVGLSDDAVNSALKAQFGRVRRLADPNKPAKPPSDSAPKRITVSLSDDVQTAILAAIAEAGKAGISMETLREKFAQGAKGDSPEAAQVLAVVKNAITEWLVDKVVGTAARGLRYFAV